MSHTENLFKLKSHPRQREDKLSWGYRSSEWAGLRGGLLEKACHSAVRSTWAEAERHLTGETRATAQRTCGGAGTTASGHPVQWVSPNTDLEGGGSKRVLQQEERRMAPLGWPAESGGVICQEKQWGNSRLDHTSFHLVIWKKFWIILQVIKIQGKFQGNYPTQQFVKPLTIRINTESLEMFL